MSIDTEPIRPVPSAPRAAAAGPDTPPRGRRGGHPIARTSVVILLFLLALWPRLVGLDTFVTTDEIFWVGRTANFARALASGRLDLTFQTGHPGVTTMWAGLLGMGPAQAQQLGSDRREVSRSQLVRQPAFLSSLVAGRRAVAVASALAIAVTGLLAWRLLGPGAALIGGALLALDPFYLAHSQLLHIDALLASCMTVGLLAGLVRWLDGGGRLTLLLSGVATGLALLAKAPALLLLGFLPLVAALAAWHRGRLLQRALWADLLAWCGIVALTYLLAWPALWVAPLQTLRGVAEFIIGNANPRHAAIAEGGAASGPFFYLAAFGLRTTPLVLAGLALLALEGGLALRRRPVDGRLAGRALALLAFALLFGLAMTVAAKSFDRYLLPAFPTLDLLGGLGLAVTARRLRWVGGAGWLLAGAFMLPLLVYPVGTSLPYALAWYNPLFGGGPAAERALSVGWGEGLDQVARYLNRKPNAASLKVALPGEIYTTVLGAQFAGQVMPAEGGDPAANGADYFVTYIRAPQDAPPVYDPRFQRWSPELVVRLAGLDYARLYDAHLGIPLGASFGETVRLEGYGLDSTISRPGRTIEATLFWRATGAPPPDLRVILVLRNAAGQEVARGASPLGTLEPGAVRPRSHSLPLPAGLSPGEYTLWVGLEDGAGRPLPLATRPEALAPGAPEDPRLAVLRSVRLQAR